jgi:tellurium resistance protein TerD
MKRTSTWLSMMATALLSFLVRTADAALGALPATHSQQEPDWTNRYREVVQELIHTARAPETGTTVTILRRIGGAYTGSITAISSNYVIIDGHRYDAPQLTDETCCQLFPLSNVSRLAAKSVLRERDDYRARVAITTPASAPTTSQVAAHEQIQTPIPPSPVTGPIDVSTDAATHTSTLATTTPPPPQPASRPSPIESESFNPFADCFAVFAFLIVAIVLIIYFASRRKVSSKVAPNPQHPAGPATCPSCGSPSIVAAKEGFDAGSGCCGAILLGPLGLLCGALGSNVMNMHCLNCGHKWRLR